jgi:hypothetical protein
VASVVEVGEDARVMMKARARFNGREIVLLGLTHANLDRLRTDGLKGCILVDGAEMGIPFDIHITAAENERAMLDAFQDSIGPDTKLHIDNKVKLKS